ncbi:RHS repeat domain-containing protein [Embleya sp. NPDC059237]|uniref:RHS repeat domain-containing protein n=1 Tax=Embleya sp. NPDC059237 TaxID=3346784 RepID=UPI00367F4AB6
MHLSTRTPRGHRGHPGRRPRRLVLRGPVRPPGHRSAAAAHPRYLHRHRRRRRSLHGQRELARTTGRDRHDHQKPADPIDQRRCNPREELKSVTDAGGNTRTYTYDFLGRVIGTTDARGPSAPARPSPPQREKSPGSTTVGPARAGRMDPAACPWVAPPDPWSRRRQNLTSEHE